MRQMLVALVMIVAKATMWKIQFISARDSMQKPIIKAEIAEVWATAGAILSRLV